MRALVGVQPSVSIDLDNSLGAFAPVTRCILNAGLLLSFCTLDKRRLLDARISASNTLTASKASSHGILPYVPGGMVALCLDAKRIADRWGLLRCFQQAICRDPLRPLI